MKLRLRPHRTHDWFPNIPAREFIPVKSVCLHCPATHVTAPYGECLGGHPMADHYQGTDIVNVPTCTWGGPS